MIASIIKKRTSGFDHLANAGRSDLMVERLVLDESKPYDRYFANKTVHIARKRMEEFGDSNGAESAGRLRSKP